MSYAKWRIFKGFQLCCSYEVAPEGATGYGYSTYGGYGYGKYGYGYGKYGYGKEKEGRKSNQSVKE